MITTLLRLTRRRRAGAHQAAPLSRRRMRGVVALGALSLAASAGFVALAANADAHAANEYVNCTSWGVSAGNYSVEENNTYSIVVDGDTANAITGSFGAGFNIDKPNAFAVGSGPHTLSGYVYENDDPNATYSYTFDLTSGPCVTYVPVPPAPAASEPGCNTDGVLTVAPPGDHVSVTGGQTGDGPGDYTITYTTDDGYSFPDGTTQVTYQITVYAGITFGEGCTEYATPVVPTITQPSCDGTTLVPGSFVPPPNTAAITYTVNGNVITATLTDKQAYAWDASDANGRLNGYTIVDETTATYTVGYDSAPDCTKTATPVEPTVTRSECSGPGTSSPAVLHIPAVEGVVYTIDGEVVTGDIDETPGTQVTVIATPADGYRFDGDQSRTYDETFDNPGDCLVTVAPVAPTPIEGVCDGPGAHSEATLAIPTTPNVIYQIDGTGADESGQTLTEAVGATVNVVASPAPGYTFAGNDQTVTYPVTFTNPGDCLTSATAVKPALTQSECDADHVRATYTIPDIAGVNYAINGKQQSPGTYDASAGSSVVVVASPQGGYVLIGDTEWTLTFAAQPKCHGAEGGSHGSNGGSPGSHPSGGRDLSSTGVRAAEIVAGGLALLVLGAVSLRLGWTRRRQRG